MGKCEECLHIDVCDKLRPIEYFLKNTCSCFQNKADVVEVVRCKDCSYSADIDGVLYCDYFNKNVNEDDYCSNGC